MIEKLRMQTPNGADEKFRLLAELFPNAITETLDDDGTPVRAIDKDVLAQEINTRVLEGREERYQFTWPDKRKAIAIANERTSMCLRPCREESVNFDTTENLYIEGDNLKVLKVLRESYMGKVKMIYIDPPYNTGKDFVYRDNFALDGKEYQENSGQFDDEGNRLVQNTESNGRYHTDWLNFMYSRLKVAKEFLSDDGVIFISISDDEIDNLKKICDEIFGDNNYLGDIVWNSTKSVTNTAIISVSHTYNLIYFKNINYFITNRAAFRLPDDGEGFANPDNDPRGAWKADPFQVGGWRPNQQYEIKNPKTGVIYKPNPGCSWKNDFNNFKKLLDDNRIVFGKTGEGSPQRKRFIWEAQERGKVVKTLWDDVETTTNGTQLLKSLFDGVSVFDNPKPVGLIKRMLQLGSNAKTIVMDFFSGSATTAHAVMQLNAEDGGNRKFIMVQLQEECDEKSEAYKAGYKNICEIGKERIRRAGKKIREEMGLQAQGVDMGFRVLKCDSSNMEEVFYTPAEAVMNPALFKADNVKPDRSAMDLLFQVMPELNIPLSARIAKVTLGGREMLSVNEGYLLAALDGELSEAAMRAAAAQGPVYFVTRDSALANDAAAANLEQIFKTISPGSVLRVL